MKSGKLIFFINIFCLFSLSLFGNESHLSMESRAGTLYVDDSGVDGIYNHSKFAFSLSQENFDFDAGYYIGGVPGDVSVRNTKLRTELKDILYFGGFCDIGISLPLQFSLDIKTLVGMMNSLPGYLVVIPGSIAVPVYGGVQWGLNMPLDFFIKAGVYGADLSVKNKSAEVIGDGSVYCFNFNGGKRWEIQKRYSHLISVDAGYMFVSGSGSVSASDELDKTFLFPYSYLHGSGAGGLSFVTFGGEYVLKGKKLSFTTELYGLINVWSKIEYSYKATNKQSLINNLINNGSIQKGNDTVTFSNADFLLLFNSQLQYNLKTDKISAGIFIRKDFIIPYISEETKNCFSQNQVGSPSGSSSDSIDVSGFLKTILLSGISVGAKIGL